MLTLRIGDYREMKHVVRTGLAGLVVSTALLLPITPLMAGQNATTPADNTKANKGVNGKSEHTADKGAGTSSDLKILKEIRRELVKDKSLSTYGHNVKVLVASGKVTLKGPVHTEEEKKAIEAHARSIAGDGNVENEISVKGDSK